MKKQIFNKLVRDKIPEIIILNGDIPEIEILDDKAYLKMLNQKLLEEANEVIEAQTVKDKTEEIADTLEVLYAILDTLGVTKQEVENIRLQKILKRGSFSKKILLKTTTKK